MDAMATDESPSQISDKIKEILFNKSAERIDAFTMFWELFDHKLIAGDQISNLMIQAFVRETLMFHIRKSRFVERSKNRTPTVFFFPRI